MVEISTGKPHLTLGLHPKYHNTEQNNVEYSKNTIRGVVNKFLD